LARETEVLEENLPPMPLGPSQTPHAAQTRTRRREASDYPVELRHGLVLGFVKLFPTKKISDQNFVCISQSSVLTPPGLFSLPYLNALIVEVQIMQNFLSTSFNSPIIADERAALLHIRKVSGSYFGLDSGFPG
jgi:hypothetical protein